MRLKSIMLLTTVMVALVSCSTKEGSKGYTINGKLNYEHGADSVFIYEYTSGGIADLKILNRAPIVDNQFTLKGTIDVPQIVMIGNIDKNLGGELILENVDYQLSSGGTDLTITGSEIHEKVLGFANKPEYQKLVENYNNVTDELFKNTDMQDEQAVKEARAKSEVLSNKVLAYEDEIFDKIINDEKEQTLTKLFALVTTQNWKVYTPKKKAELLNEYEKELGNHINIVKERELMAKEEGTSEMAESVKNGSSYKELVANDINGNPIALSELVKKNKYTLLEFWASWCGPCRGEIPNLKKAYKKYKDSGLEIYSVSIDSKRKDWEAALEEEQTTWPNSLIVGNDEQAQVAAYGVQGIPASYLISQDGTIVASNEELREFDLDKTLSKLFDKK